MTSKNLVLRSINTEDGARCVDVFRRPDGTFGFEEYRRDVEDGRGWFAIGHWSAQPFATQDEASGAARRAIEWLRIAAGG